jgi:2-polyprenyl-3-methyl-5-hydroxy-6-metoxy-1,4-benzoquinol methylase
MPAAHKIDDAEWLELQFDAPRARAEYGIELPAMPSDDVQRSFTAQCGRSNMQQAFSFYRCARAACGMDQLNEPRVLDFGGGWGRIARLFLRDTTPERIVVAETMNFAVECLRETGAQFQVFQNKPFPPIGGLTGSFDLIIAYSVFSHLSEPYFRAWVDYLLSLLLPGAPLVFTTRGTSFIAHLEHLHRETAAADEMLREHIRRLREEMPSPAEIRRCFLSGDFQFYPIGGAGELTPDFFGEAFIPREYIERHYPDNFVSFDEGVPYVDQSVVVLRRPHSSQSFGGRFWGYGART